MLLLRAFPLLAALAAAGCGPGAAGGDSDAGSPAAPALPDAHEVPFGEPHSLVTRDGAYRITWSPTRGVVPINRDFTIDVEVTTAGDAPTPVTGATVLLNAFMPDHGHGMLREPRARELGEGRYLVEGFLLHMDGFWTVDATVVVDGLASSADDELRL